MMKHKKIWTIVTNVLIVIVMVVAVAFFVMNAITAPIIVDGQSMMPTLQNLDYGKMNISRTKRKHIARFDIVIFEDETGKTGENSILIKRVIGLPEETIFIDPVLGELKVNDKVVNQTFLDDETLRLTCSSYTTTHLACGKSYKVPKNSYYVLGDNRNHSTDSEHGLGPIDKASIHGVLWYINATCASIEIKEKNGEKQYVCSGKKSKKIQFF